VSEASQVYRVVPVLKLQGFVLCCVNCTENSQTFQKHFLAAHETRNRRTAQSAQHPVFVCGGLPKIVGHLILHTYASYLHAPVLTPVNSQI